MARIHVAVATPMHSDLCHGTYKHSVMALERIMRTSGHRLSPLHLGNESHIGRARNTLAWHFLNGPEDGDQPTHLLWWDGDIAVRPQDIAAMLGADKDIIVGICPLKAINWARVWAAARCGVPADQLARYSGIFNIVHKPGGNPSASAPFEIERGGTGLMLVKRQVYTRMIKASPDLNWYWNRNPGDAMPAGAKVYDFHPSPVVEHDFYSEDYGFCDLWARMGGQIFAAPWCEITHAGTYRFSGSYADCMGLPQAVAAAAVGKVPVVDLNASLEGKPESVD